MTKQVIIPIKQAGGTAAELLIANPIGYERQVIFETDTLRVKLLDGVTSYNDLPYLFSSSSTAWGSISGTLSDQTDLQNALNAKQATLVSGTNIKTINGTSLLGSGDLTIASGVSIGDPVGSGTANNILFVGSGGVLAQSTGITYSDSNGLIITPTGTIVSGFKAGINIVSANPTLRLTDGVRGFGVFHSGTVTYIATTTTAWGSASYFGNIVGNKMFIGGTNSASAMLHIKAASATDIGLIVQGTTSQSGNLFEARNVSDTVIASINSSGGGVFPNIKTDIVKLTYINSNDNSVSAFYVANSTGNTQFLGGRFQFGGTTSSFPALKRNGTAIDIRLADDSGYGGLNAGTIVAYSSVRFAQSTVAGLPASPLVGDKYVVTDASGAAVVGSIVVGGGATMVEVVWANGGVGWKITSRY